MSKLSALTRNRLARAGGYAVGVLLFYAPFALLIRGVGAIFPASTAGTSVADVHTACLRMPLGWLVQPWMWPTLGSNPISWLPVLVLPGLAVAASPLFCGWLCPAGALPEYIGRIVPERFKFDPRVHLDIVPLRYGFFVGFLLAPFISTSICCSFCNFTHMQNIVSATFGDLSGFTYFTTMGVIAAAVWIVPLGMFTKGGRGWCLFLCPAGTTMGLASSLTARLPWTRRVRTDSAGCASCGRCDDMCPMRAIGTVPNEANQTAPVAEVASGEGPAPDAPTPDRRTVDHHLCNGCMDCVRACPSGGFYFGRPR